jgi:hypothetical protein
MQLSRMNRARGKERRSKSEYLSKNSISPLIARRFLCLLFPESRERVQNHEYHRSSHYRNQVITQEKMSSLDCYHRLATASDAS